jgi:hypothetical protein
VKKKFFEIWQVWAIFSMRNPLHRSKSYFFQVQIWQKFASRRIAARTSQLQSPGFGNAPPMGLTHKASGLMNINIGLLGRSRYELALNGTCPRWALIELGRFGIPLFVLLFQKMTKS